MEGAAILVAPSFFFFGFLLEGSESFHKKDSVG